MLKQRIITAIILIPLVVWSILALDSSIIAGLSAIFVILAAWEWAGLCGWQTVRQRSFYTIVMTIILGAWYWWYTRQHYHPPIFLLIAFFWWLLALFWVISYQRGRHRLPTRPLTKALVGFFVLLPAWTSLVFLHSWDRKMLLFLLILIWIADSGAYFIGKRFGKHKLADKISPGKTWEGVAGGLLAGSLFALWVGGLLMVDSDIPLQKLIPFVIFCILTLTASILGDLLESLFKRQVGFKDSGQLLPGHGGILDRIDSLTAALPIFVYSLLLYDTLFFGCQLI